MGDKKHLSQFDKMSYYKLTKDFPFFFLPPMRKIKRRSHINVCRDETQLSEVLPFKIDFFTHILKAFIKLFVIQIWALYEITFYEIVLTNIL